MYAGLKGKRAQLGKEDLQGGWGCIQQVSQACWLIRMGSRVVGHHDRDSIPPLGPSPRGNNAGRLSLKMHVHHVRVFEVTCARLIINCYSSICIIHNMECVPSPKLVDLPEDNSETQLVKLSKCTLQGQEKLLMLKAKEEAKKRKAKVRCQEEKEKERVEAQVAKVAMQQATAQLVPSAGLSRPLVSLLLGQCCGDC